MIGALAVLLLGIQATCGAPGGWPLERFDRDACPQVYRIQGTAPVHESLNIVVLPDGFTEEELDTFRCAAGMMMEKLAAIPPFDEFSDSINVYRIDLASSSSGPDYPERCGRMNCHAGKPNWPTQACQCEAFAERSGLPLPLRGEPLLPEVHDSCLKLDLDLKDCPSSARECQVLWPEGEGLRKLWRVATCAPAHDIVIVLANSGAWAGGGTQDLHPPLAVASLNQISSWSHRSRLLAHEIGHTLGLLDEYPKSSASPVRATPNPDSTRAGISFSRRRVSFRATRRGRLSAPRASPDWSGTPAGAASPFAARKAAICPSCPNALPSGCSRAAFTKAPGTFDRARTARCRI